MSNEVGTWDVPYEKALKIVGVHAVVLHTGKVLYFCFDQRAVGQLNANNRGPIKSGTRWRLPLDQLSRLAGTRSAPGNVPLPTVRYS
jgi:hypothetical protein